MSLLREDLGVRPFMRHQFKTFYHLIQWIIIFLIGLSVNGNLAFNIDVSSPRIYQGTPESYFGFAVELHREEGENMVLVGAPHAQTNQPGVNSGGAFYKCPFYMNQEQPLPTQSSSSSSSSSPCDQIVFDSSGNDLLGGEEIANKSGQMFGATIKSSGPDGTVLVCRPLYTWFYYVDSHPNTGRFPVGGCFFAKQNFTQIETFNPCKSADSSMFFSLMCEAGFSATVSKTEWIIGAIGTFYGQGELLVGNFTSNTYRRTQVIDDAKFDNIYRGHSVAFGDFFGDGEVEYVTGIPRGTVNLRGLVEFRDRGLHRYLTINGYQIGSYFGHSLVVADFNNDGYDDIVISSPMYTAVSISDGWEVGRIHIYYNDQQGGFPVSHTISGEWPGGRFGFAMITIGDINRDGYTDLAVSAPYFGEEKEGRVSIFLSTGSRGLSSTHSQHITPSQFGMRIKSFGFSLAGGLDMDNNTYPDLVVGSYLSSTAVLFRSRPVVELNVTLALNGSEGIDLDDRNFLLADGSRVPSFRLSLCILFAGEAVPQHLNVSYTLSSTEQTPSRFLLLVPTTITNADSLSQVVELSKNTGLCTHHTGYILNSIRDKLTPLRFRVEYEIVSNESKDDDQLLPILDSKFQPHKDLSIPFKNNCNSTICVPDLSISASSDISEMVVGSSASLHLNVSISNNGEDAYESVLNFTQPKDLHFMQIIQLTKNNHLITCDKKIGQQNGRKDLVCDLGNPLVAHEQIIMQLLFVTDDIRGDSSEVSFLLEASSVHNDSNPSDNVASVDVNVIIRSDVNLQGVSESEYLLYDQKNYQGDHNITDDEIIIHQYILRNGGPSDVGQTAVLIRFPYSTSDSTTNHGVIELIDARVEGGDRCELVQTYSTPAAVDDDRAFSPIPTTSHHTHPLSTSYATEGPAITQPYFGRAPARRRKRRTDIGAMNNLTVNDNYYITLNGDIHTIDCLDRTGCYEITCNIDTVGTRRSSIWDSVTITVTSRFNIDLFLRFSNKLNITASVALISDAEVTIYGSNYPVQLSENITLTATATTRIAALQQVLVADGVDDLSPYQPGTLPKASIWMIIGACVLGVVILASTNAVLYKMGFFKRQRIGMEENVSVRKKPDRMSLRQRSVIFDD